jgi:hypothetical protein
MAIQVPSNVIFIFHVLSACGLIIGGSACAYALSRTSLSFKIPGGPPDKAPPFAYFLDSLVLLVLCICEFIFALVEIAMCVPQVTQVNVLKLGYVRPILYIACGILTLGVVGDLGIAAGSIILICAAFWLILAIAATLG